MAIGDTVNPALMRTDFSVFQQAGLANARANEAFGNAVGNFIDDFYKKKKDKEDRQERESFFRSQGFTPPEAKAASGDKDLANFLEKKRVEDRNYELAKGTEKRLSDTAEFTRGRLGRADEIAEQDREALVKFSGDLLSETIDPEVARQVEEVRPGMFALGNEGQRNRFLDYQQEQQPKVAVGELGSSDFAKVARERGLDPTLAGGRFMNLQKTEQETLEKNLGTLGDQFASTIGPVDHHFFSEADAVNAINERANKMGIVLNKEQMESALSSQRIVDLKELRAESMRQIKTSKLTEAVSILEAGKALNEFLDDGGPLSINVAKEKLARMVQPDGILTESDLSRVGGSKGLVDRINAAIKEISDGTADEQTKKYLRATAGIFSKSASDKINFEGPRISTYLSRTFRIGVDDVWDYTTVGDFYDYVEAPVTNGTGASPAGSSRQPSAGASSLPGGGRFTPSN